MHCSIPWEASRQARSVLRNSSKLRDLGLTNLGLSDSEDT